MPDHDLLQATSTSSSSAVTTGASTSMVEPDAQDLLGNAAINELLASTDPKVIEPTLTGIVHLGLNAYAADEARALNRYNADKGGAKGIRDSGDQDALTRDGQRFDLTKDVDRAAFVARLGLAPDKAQEVERFISSGGREAKDELGQLIEVYVQAEQGVRRMDRMVLSGHSIGDEIWGDDNGEIPFTTLERLAGIFPNAAGQVKHLMVSACYTGGETNVAVFQRMFPNLESLLAYSGSSPGTWSGAMDHMQRWEKATEDGDGSDVEKDIVSGTRKAGNVATWNLEDGYQGDERMSVTAVEAELSSQDSVYQRFYSGTEVVANSQTGPLRDYYNLLQRAISHPELDSGRAEELRHRRDITIRLLYFSLVASKFSVAYATQLSDGYAEAGRALPDFTKLSRADAILEAEALATATGAAAQRAHELLQKGLVELDEGIIPTAWI